MLRSPKNKKQITGNPLCNVHIVIHLQDKLNTLFNRAKPLDVNCSPITDTIPCREKCLCRYIIPDSHLHCHNVTQMGV